MTTFPSTYLLALTTRLLPAVEVHQPAREGASGLEAVGLPRGLEVQVAATVVVGQVETATVPVPVAHAARLAARVRQAEETATSAHVVPVVPAGPTDAGQAALDVPQATVPASAEVAPTRGLETAGPTLRLRPLLGHPRALGGVALLVLGAVGP